MIIIMHFIYKRLSKHSRSPHLGFTQQKQAIKQQRETTHEKTYKIKIKFNKIYVHIYIYIFGMQQYENLTV